MSNALIVQLTLLSAVVAGMCAVYVMLKTRDMRMFQAGVRGAPGEVSGAGLVQHVASPVEIQEDRGTAVPANAPQDVPEETLGVRPAEQEPQPMTLPIRKPSPKLASDDHARLRREVIGRDSEMRFAVLKEWLSINMLAIFRRALGDWKTANDLIAIIPSYLEPEAEILNDSVLLVSTRGHAGQLAVPIGNFDSSDLGLYFDFLTTGLEAANNPAVLRRSSDHSELVSKGTITWAAMTRMRGVERKRAADVPWGMECIIVAGFTAKASERVFRQYLQESFNQDRIIETVAPSEGH